MLQSRKVPIGTIAYIQDGHRPFGFGRYHSVVCREPWIVVAYLNREYHPCSTNRPATTYMRGGHLYIVRSLRSGRTTTVADWILCQCEEMGLTR